MVFPVIVVIDLIQTTWRQFGCFVTWQNTLDCHGVAALQRPFLFHARRLSGSLLA
jgi:hypothetical protein